jgi:hypothetical protein
MSDLTEIELQIAAKNRAWEVIRQWRYQKSCGDETLAAIVTKAVLGKAISSTDAAVQVIGGDDIVVVKVDPAIIDTIAEALGSSFSRIGLGPARPARLARLARPTQAINRDRYVAAFAAIGRDVPDWMRDRAEDV